MNQADELVSQEMSKQRAAAQEEQMKHQKELKVGSVRSKHR